MSSLGSPISQFTPQIAKADKYLAGWQAPLLNHMGRATLVNSVLDSQLVHAMCALLIPPGVIGRVDQRRRAFLWAGGDSTSGAKCLVAFFLRNRQESCLVLKRREPKKALYKHI